MVSKATSSQNAIRHGILSASLVMNGENPEAFRELIAELYDEFQPATPFQMSLVDNMAAAQWRQGRLWNIENSITGEQIGHEYYLAQQQSAQDPEIPAITASDILTARAFRTLADESRTLDLVSRYESRLDRQYLRSHRRLLEVQGKWPNSPKSPKSPQGPSPQPSDPPHQDSEMRPGLHLVPSPAPENPTAACHGIRERNRFLPKEPRGKLRNRPSIRDLPSRNCVPGEFRPR